MTRRALLTVALPALAAIGVLAATGLLDLLHAALLVVVAVTAGVLWRRLDDGTEVPWPDPPENRREGARNDVSELGWATFTRSGAVGDRVLRRVRELAVARLGADGVDLAAPGGREAAERLLGADVVAGVTARRQVTRAEVHRWLDAIEALDAPARSGGPAPAPRTATPTPPSASTAGRPRP
ncbi:MULTISPECIES: hypothetical protein [unclassified Isoptericola]|uniref:hypothetical protein n=1 Tax=unclassified Isoptericola TaxID=2623355 RepID=UPI0036550279